MTDFPRDDLEDASNPFAAGIPVRFDLIVPCNTFVYGLMCGTTEAYLTVKPYGTSFHYERRCANGHFVDNVKHAEVELHFGIPRPANGSQRLAVQDALTPPRRVAFNTKVRDNGACVYCGRRAGEVGMDGAPVVLDADHIIAKDLIDVKDIKGDKELLYFARDRQLVTACRSDNSAKRNALIDLDFAREMFIRHVLRGKTEGTNRSEIAMFERLYRIVAHRLRLKNRAS